MATCSSIAEPVLVFQFPDIDVLLECLKHKKYIFQFCFSFTYKGKVTKVCLYIHVRFVVSANLLDPDVVLGVDERFGGGVRLGESHDTGYVLELTVIVHLHLYAKKTITRCETDRGNYQDYYIRTIT